jgi:hypothetical protein
VEIIYGVNEMVVLGMILMKDVIKFEGKFTMGMLLLTRKLAVLIQVNIGSAKNEYNILSTDELWPRRHTPANPPARNPIAIRGRSCQNFHLFSENEVLYTIKTTNV